ncbi:hypothetical protein SAMN05216423_1705 [Streptococcus equinus]|nr:hypothetical protein SAMN05216423_1705 [Streptococcus equinus]
MKGRKPSYAKLNLTFLTLSTKKESDSYLILFVFTKYSFIVRNKVLNMKDIRKKAKIIR